MIPCPLTTHPLTTAVQLHNTVILYPQLNTLIARVTSYLQRYKGVCVLYTPTCSIESIAFILGAFRAKVSLCLIPSSTPQHSIKKVHAAFTHSTHTFTAPSVMWHSPPLYDQLWDLSHTALYMLTSGTTSTPKIVPLTLGNLYHATMQAIPRLGLLPSSRYLLTLPLYHLSGVGALLRTLCSGGTLLLPPNRKDPFTTFSSMTHCSCVPHQLPQLLTKYKNHQSIKALLIGGAPLPQWLFDEVGHLPLILSFGMTETTGTHMMTLLTNPPTTPEQIGWPLSKHSCHINKNNILEVKGGNCFKGYLNGPQNTQWFSTKDCVEFDKTVGYLYKYRADRMIINKGENIYPEVVEALVNTYRGVLYSKLNKDPSKKDSLTLTIATNTNISLKSVEKFLRSRLAKQKCPDTITLLPKHLLK